MKKIEKNAIAIIPARGGSKRLPRKNILPLHGEPLISWTIKSAINSGCFDTICVSTDDLEIAKISENYGAEVPFIRPENISGDHASSVDLVLHALQFYSEIGVNFKKFVLLQPTSPLRTPIDIQKVFEISKTENVSSVVSVCETEHSPLWSNKLPSNNSLDGFISKELKNLRSQDLPTYYRINGSIYLHDVESFLKEKQFVSDYGGVAYIMPRERSIDIDTMLDFRIAETILA